MSVAFSGDAETVIDRRAEAVSSNIRPTFSDTEQLAEYYQLSGCASWIVEHNFQRIALQFPDQLLKDAVPITIWLSQQTGRALFILADTSYGSCCVDEVAAEHVHADCIVHFGHWCCSATSRLPVQFVFPDRPLDGAVIASQVLLPMQTAGVLADTTVVVFCDVAYLHAVDDVCTRLSSYFEHVVAALPARALNQPLSARDVEAEGQCESEKERRSEEDDQWCILNRRVCVPVERRSAVVVLFVGSSSSSVHEEPDTADTSTLVAMQLPDAGASRMWQYNPASDRPAQLINAGVIERLLRRRRYLVERVRDANTVGIVVGTLSVRHYRTAISRLKRQLAQAGKRHYTLLLGRLNTAKLANFSRLDVCVLVACAESSVLLHNRHFLQPLVTPFEVQLACCGGGVGGEFISDFNSLPADSSSSAVSETGAGSTDVSLISGKLRWLTPDCESSEPVDDETSSGGAGSELATRADMTPALPSSGHHWWPAGAWRGLEPRRGDTAVTSAITGMTGVPQQYCQADTTPLPT